MKRKRNLLDALLKSMAYRYEQLAAAEAKARAAKRVHLREPSKPNHKTQKAPERRDGVPEALPA